MLLVADAIQELNLTVSPETPLKDVMVLTNNWRKKNPLTQELWIVENLYLLGVLTVSDLFDLITSGINLEQIKVAEVMKSAITLEPNYDYQTTLSLMRQYDIKSLPIVNQKGEIIEIVTTEKIATILQAELSNTKKKLESEIKEHNFVKTQLDDLANSYKLLQHKVCDNIATEAQLLQTTRELQELFQAFPDIYFRLKSDGTVLSFYNKEIFQLYLPPEKFLGKKIQSALPPAVANKFQSAISQVLETNTLIAIEFSLSIASVEKNFEARLQNTIGYNVIVIIRDITERKQAEINLQKTKDELEIRVEERTYELKNTNSLLRQEIIERKRIEEELRFRVDFEKLITTISTYFINLAAGEIDNGINRALEAIGNFVNVDRSYVFLLTENDEKINNTHEWCASGIPPRIDELKDIYIQDFTLFMDRLDCGEILQLDDLRGLLLIETVETRVFKIQDIKSLIILPIACSGTLIGFLGFESLNATTWTENSIILLKIVAEILGNALGRKRVEEALRVSEERYAQAISAGKVGVWEWNIQTNEVYIDSNLKAMLGYKDEEVANQFINWLQFVHSDDVGLVKAEINAYLEQLIPKYEIEHRMLHKNGDILGFLTRATVIRDEKGIPTFMAASSTDITARKQAENKLKSSLKEKEVLIKEIHHRVKNNLQFISSLLRLQSRYIEDKKALEIFRDTQIRLRAMALIHENLYKTNNLAKIEFSDYIRKLMHNLMIFYQINNINININTNIEKIFLNIDTVIPCALIVNELVSNSIKHAFDNDKNAEIYVDFFSSKTGKYSLSVRDNGVGVPSNIDICKKQSLGLQLVWNLVEQLEGTIVYNSKFGTLFRILFTDNS